MFSWQTQKCMYYPFRKPPNSASYGKSLHHHHYHHLFLNREGCWGTTDDFTIRFLHFLCSPLTSGTWRTPGLSIPWCYLATSSSVCLVFLPFSLCFARWFWPDLMNGRHDHTTAVCVSLRLVERSSCCSIACWILALTSSLVTWSLYEMCSILQ